MINTSTADQSSDSKSLVDEEEAKADARATLLKFIFLTIAAIAHMNAMWTLVVGSCTILRFAMRLVQNSVLPSRK